MAKFTGSAPDRDRKPATLKTNAERNARNGDTVRSNGYQMERRATGNRGWGGSKGTRP